MWDRVTDIAKTAAAMLQSGKVPPNTPSQYREDLGKVNFLASRKFFVVFTSVLMLMAFYAASIFVLFLTAFCNDIDRYFAPYLSSLRSSWKLSKFLRLSFRLISDYRPLSISNTILLPTHHFVERI